VNKRQRKKQRKKWLKLNHDVLKDIYADVDIMLEKSPLLTRLTSEDFESGTHTSEDE